MRAMLIFGFLCVGSTSLCANQEAGPIAVGSRLELFVDDYLVDELNGGARRKLNRPTPQEVVFVSDRPWEGNILFHVTIFRDDDLYRMYYRGQHFDEATQEASEHKVICYAESDDAIHWRRPELGIHEFNGSKRNNIILDCKSGAARNGAFAVFKDDNPECPPESRYKALALHRKNGNGLYAFHSRDAIRWSLMSERPVITEGAFDSHNLAFWDVERGEYRDYHRFFRDGVRDILTATSTDFLKWTDPVPLEYFSSPIEHLYTNAIRPYHRAPHILLGFPKRLLPKRPPIKPHPYSGVSDGVFMSSRDRVRFTRWSEAFVRPGPQADRWVNRNNFTAWGLIETPSTMEGAPNELSIYTTEGYYTGKATRLRRNTLRIDGFVSVEAPLSGGELLSKPITFTGASLVLNFATSAAGGVRVELQDSGGQPLPGHTLKDCREIYGDALERTVSWRRGADISGLSGKAVRLRFVLKDADLYSFQFR